MSQALARLVLCAISAIAIPAAAEGVDAGANRAAPEAAPARRITEAQARETVAAIGAAGLGENASAAFERLVAEAGPGYLPPELGLGELESEVVCAKAVSRIFWSAFGREDDLATARGVSGDAWNMSANVRLFGGESFPWSDAAAASLRPGDILGLHYALSVYNDRPKSVDYTHVALVIAVTEADGPLVVHCWRPPENLFPPGTAKPWPMRIEFLGDLLSGYPGLFEVREVIRPRRD